MIQNTIRRNFCGLMDSQYSNDHLAEVDCSQSFVGMSIPVIGAPVPSNLWEREAGFSGSSLPPPFLRHAGWSVEASKPIQTQQSWQDTDVKEDKGFSEAFHDVKQFESNSQTELMPSYLQSTTVDVGACTVAPERHVSNDSNLILLPGHPNHGSTGEVQEIPAKDCAGEVSVAEEEEKSYWVPKVLWTEEMIELHARVNVLTRKCRGRKNSEIHTELKIARGKFKYWYKRTRAAMQELPDFEELKKIAIEEKKCFQKEKLIRRSEDELRRIRKMMPPLITGPPLIGISPQITRPPLMPDPPFMSGPPYMSCPPVMSGSSLMPGPPPMTGALQVPMQLPSGNRRPFNRGTRHQRDPPFYSNSSNSPRFPERNGLTWSPDMSEHYMRGYRSGFVSSTRTNSKPYKPSRNFTQSSSSGFSSAW